MNVPTGRRELELQLMTIGADLADVEWALAQLVRDIPPRIVLPLPRLPDKPLSKIKILHPDLPRCAATWKTCLQPATAPYILCIAHFLKLFGHRYQNSTTHEDCRGY